jgi:hypothetical protein
MLALALTALSCGRSDNVGWANREQPDSAAREAARQAATPSPSADTTQSEVARVEEYQRLIQALSSVQMEVMSDPTISGLWNRLVADIDAAILSRSDFHRQLIARRDEIDSLVASSQRPGGEELSRDRLLELGRYYRNIQVEMARVRNQELHKPEFRERYAAFQAALFAKMRELAPDRAAEVDRLEQLDVERFLAMDTVPQVPSMLPPGIQPQP